MKLINYFSLKCDMSFFLKKRKKERKETPSTNLI